MMQVSVCMIAKNEEANIEACLQALKPYPFEIVLVDTGSADRTKEIAAQYTDKIYDFEWINDFSAARNFSISKASHDWILVIDCDEFVESIDLKQLYGMEKHKQTICTITRRNTCVGGGIDIDRAQRFFCRKFFRYTGRIHEQIAPLPYKSFAPTGFDLDIQVHHTGYDGTQEDLNAKATRNLDLLELELQDNPEDPYTLFQIGQSYYVTGDYEKAYPYFDKALTYDIDDAAPYLILLVVSYGYTLLRTERLEQALGFTNIYDDFSDSADFVFLMGSVYLAVNQPLKALLEFLKATTLTKHFTEGVNSYSAYYKIGLIYEAMGEKEKAILFYQKAPQIADTLVRLTQLE